MTLLPSFFITPEALAYLKSMPISKRKEKKMLIPQFYRGKKNMRAESSQSANA